MTTCSTKKGMCGIGCDCGICADFYDGISFRAACSLSDFVTVNDSGPVTSDRKCGACVYEPNSDWCCCDAEWMVAGDGDRLAIPQVDSVNRKRNLSEGKKKKTSGTCGKRVQIGRDIYEDMWEITFTQCKGVPIEGAYLCRNQCAWFAWKDCCCNYGEVGKGIVSFPNDQLLDVVTEDAETTEVVRITFIEGPFWVENPTNVERCWPQEISCVTAACPCGRAVDPCSCEEYNNTASGGAVRLDACAGEGGRETPPETEVKKTVAAKTAPAATTKKE